MKKIISLVLRMSVSLGIIGFLVYTFRSQGETIWGLITHIPLENLLIAGGLSLSILIVLSLRYYYLLQGQQIELSKIKCLQLNFIGLFFNNFLPTGAGGDLMKGYLTAKESNKTAGSVVAVLMDRMIGLAVILFLVSLSGLLLANSSLKIPAAVLNSSYYLLSAIAVIGIVVFRPQWFAPLGELIKRFPIEKIKEGINRFIEALKLYRHTKSAIIKGVGLSLFSQILFTGIIYVFSLGIGVSIPYFQLLFVLPLIHAATVLPSINGLGVREGALVFLLGETIGPEKALTLAILSTALITFWGLSLGGGCYIYYLMKRKTDDSKRTTRDLSLSQV